MQVVCLVVYERRLRWFVFRFVRVIKEAKCVTGGGGGEEAIVIT